MKGKRLYKRLFLCSLALVAGCATIIQGTTQEIPVTSNPSGATVVVDGGPRFKTPANLVLSRKEPHKLEIALQGYHPEAIELKSVTSAAVAGNIIAGGLVGWAIDSTSGAQNRLVPEVVHVDLRPVSEGSEPSVQKASEETK